jgi:hypothetical protein
MTEKNYWGGNGTHQELADRLAKLVPTEGPVLKARRNPALERFRQASNAYYDLYNNGGCNRAGSIARLFGSGLCGLARSRAWNLAFARTEPRMDAYVLAAAAEQGIRPCPERAQADAMLALIGEA